MAKARELLNIETITVGNSDNRANPLIGKGQVDSG
jgi:hypothetical protein